LGNSGSPIPVGRREEFFTAEDAEDAEKKTEGNSEMIWIEDSHRRGRRGRREKDREKYGADWRSRANRFARLLGVSLCVLCGEK
jgi:hypothetical protein